MSKKTELRGEQKREEIRKIIWRLLCECPPENTLEKSFKTISKHIEVMKIKNPRENHLVTSVCCEIKRDVKGFVDRMISKYRLRD